MNPSSINIADQLKDTAVKFGNIGKASQMKSQIVVPKGSPTEVLDFFHTPLDGKQEELNVENVTKDILENHKDENNYYLMKSTITSALEDIQKEIDQMELQLTLYTKEYGPDIDPYLFKEVTGYEAVVFNEKLASLKNDKETYQSFLYQVEEKLKSLPYEKMRESKEYQEFAKNYSYKNLGIDFTSLWDAGFNVEKYIQNVIQTKGSEGIRELEEKGILSNTSHDYAMDKLALVEYLIDNGYNDVVNQVFPTETDYYDYMSEEQRLTYHYLFKTQGANEAAAYIEAIQDSINQAKGAALANRFIESLDLTDEGKLTDSLSNFFGVSTKGLGDGITTFLEGLNNIFKNDGTLSAEEYERMIILQYLQENSNILDETYQFSTSLGNMVPAMATSALVSILATPAAGSLTGSALMGTSAFGNAKHQALAEGNDLLSSTLYGIFIGTSETTLGYFLGKIPGLSKASGFTLKNLFSEGAEEFLQEWVDAGLQTVILGKEVDWSQIPEQSMDSFLMGFLMAGFLNGGQSVVNIMKNGQSIMINVEKTLDLLSKNPEMGIKEAFAQANHIDDLNTTVEEELSVIEEAEPTEELTVIEEAEPTEELSVIDEADITEELIITEEDMRLQNQKTIEAINSIAANAMSAIELHDPRQFVVSKLIEVANSNPNDNSLIQKIDGWLHNDQIKTDVLYTEFSQYFSAEETRTYDHLTKLSAIERVQANTDIAIQFNDPKQFIISKFSEILNNNPNDQGLIDLMYDYSCKNVNQIELSQLYFDFSPYLSLEEYNIFNTIMDHYNENIYTKTEKSVIGFFTKIAGPIIEARLRKADCTFYSGGQSFVYPGSDLKTINRYIVGSLVQTGYMSQLPGIQTVDKFAKILDRIIDKSPRTKKPMTVYRSVNSLFLNGNKIETFNIGQKFNDPAFTSVSVVPTNISSSNNILLEIEVPAGTKAAYIEQFTGTSLYSQQELLLHRNCEFEITDMLNYNEKTGQITLKVKLNEKQNFINEVKSKVSNSNSLSQFYKSTSSMISPTSKSIINQYQLENIDQANQATNYYNQFVERGSEFDLQQVDLIDVLSKMKSNGLLTIFDDTMNKLYNRNDVYQLNLPEHGIDHVERVLFFALYMGGKYNLSASDMNILIEASKYHDVGRVTLQKNDGHGHSSAARLREILNGIYSEDEINKMCAVIEYHEIDDGPNVSEETKTMVFENLCKQYNIKNKDIESVKKMATILKDSDAIDRVRFPGNLDANYLRTDVSKQLVKAAYQLQEIRATNELNSNISNGKYSKEIVDEIAQLRDINIPDFLLNYYYKYQTKGVRNYINQIIQGGYNG